MNKTSPLLYLFSNGNFSWGVLLRNWSSSFRRSVCCFHLERLNNQFMIFKIPLYKIPIPKDKSPVVGWGESNTHDDYLNAFKDYATRCRKNLYSPALKAPLDPLTSGELVLEEIILIGEIRIGMDVTCITTCNTERNTVTQQHHLHQHRRELPSIVPRVIARI